MPTIDELQAKTAHFFFLHWHGSVGAIPEWSTPWEYCGTMPNNMKQGCYAIFNDQAIIYIGLGAGYGTEAYPHAGLGQRLHKYWRVHPNKEYRGKDRVYVPSNNWQEATSIITIGFEPDGSYLAHSLEQYLIRELSPERNTDGKKRFAD